MASSRQGSDKTGGYWPYSDSGVFASQDSRRQGASVRWVLMRSSGGSESALGLHSAFGARTRAGCV